MRVFVYLCARVCVLGVHLFKPYTVPEREAVSLQTFGAGPSYVTILIRLIEMLGLARKGFHSDRGCLLPNEKHEMWLSILVSIQSDYSSEVDEPRTSFTQLPFFIKRQWWL